LAGSRSSICFSRSRPGADTCRGAAVMGQGGAAGGWGAGLKGARCQASNLLAGIVGLKKHLYPSPNSHSFHALKNATKLHACTHPPTHPSTHSSTHPSTCPPTSLSAGVLQLILSARIDFHTCCSVQSRTLSQKGNLPAGRLGREIRGGGENSEQGEQAGVRRG
jgi:hypothetical protein